MSYGAISFASNTADSVGSPPAIDGLVSNSVGGAGSATLVLPGLTTAVSGDYIICLIAAYDGAGNAIVSCTGSTLGALTQRASANRAGYRYVYEYWIKATGTLAGEVITVVMNNINTPYTACAFGVSGASGFDSGGPQTVNYGAAAYATMTTANANTLVFGVALCESTATPTIGSGWSTLYAPGTNSVMEYQTSATTNTFTLTSNIAVGDSDGKIIDALKA